MLVRCKVPCVTMHKGQTVSMTRGERYDVAEAHAEVLIRVGHAEAVEEQSDSQDEAAAAAEAEAAAEEAAAENKPAEDEPSEDKPVEEVAEDKPAEEAPARRGPGRPRKNRGAAPENK